MIPLRDNIPSRTVPYVNYALIGICCLIYFVQSMDPEGDIVMDYGLIPVRVSHPDQEVVIRVPTLVRDGRGVDAIVYKEETLPPSPVSPLATLLTCVFLHGSILHLLGNMWFLYIFGDNVEDRLGHWGYVLFYVACGCIASGVHYLSDMNSSIPTIGASGAVAGVMGAYLLLYPHAQVMSLVPIFIFLHMMVLPAPLFLGIWFLLQLLQGTFSIGAMEAGGVAWWAHVGGFVAGMGTAWFLNQTGTARPKVVVVRPGTERSGIYRINRPRP